MRKVNLSIFLKIWLSVSVLIGGYLISLVLLLFSGQKMETSLNKVSEIIFPAASISQKVLATFEKQTKSYETAVMTGNTDMVQKATGESERVQSFLQEIMALKGLSEDKRSAIEGLAKTLKSFTGDSSAIYSRMASGEMDQSIIEKAGKQRKSMEELDAKLSTASREFSDELKREIGSTVKYSQWEQRFNLILFGIVLTVSIVVLWLVAKRAIVEPIKHIVGTLNDGTEEVASASGQVSSASQSLAEGASRQVIMLEEAASSLDQTDAMTKQNADNAQQTNNLMKEVTLVVQRASEFMEKLTTSMGEITKASEETAKIIKTIDEIAFQTNLLALNAAVEAARAGEAGAGFAVVADEVRSLAMRAAEAAKSTAILLEGTANKVKDGSQLLEKTDSAFSEVAQSATKVSELVGEIAAASHEQAKGIDSVSRAMAEMDNMTKQTAANAEESASAAEEMSAQAMQMREIVRELAVLVGGSRDVTVVSNFAKVGLEVNSEPMNHGL